MNSTEREAMNEALDRQASATYALRQCIVNALHSLTIDSMMIRDAINALSESDFDLLRDNAIAASVNAVELSEALSMLSEVCENITLIERLESEAKQ